MTAGSRILLEDVQVTEAGILAPLRDVSVARTIFPIKNILKSEQKQVKYYTYSDEHVTDYTMDIVNSPLSNSVSVPVTVDCPAIHGDLWATWDDYKLIQAGKLTMDDAVRNWAVGAARDEDRILIAGDPNMTAAYGISDTTNASTAATAELNVTSIALVASTLGGMINQLIDGLKSTAFPLVLMVSTDVYKVMNSVYDTTAEKYVLDFVLEMLTRNGQSGAVIISDNLGATVTKSSAGYSVGAVTTNAALMAISTEHFGAYTSPIEFRTRADNPNQIDGYLAKGVERVAPYFKRTEAIIYSGTVVVA